MLKNITGVNSLVNEVGKINTSVKKIYGVCSLIMFASRQMVMESLSPDYSV